MPINGINQPEIININENYRLRKYDGNYKIAVKWYQDETVYYNSEGITDKNKIPDEDYVKCMYEYLENHGECYFIEVKENNEYIPVGDVTIKEENPPIVIGEAKYRGIGLGKKVFMIMIARVKELKIPKIHDSIVYDYNIPSQKLHESLVFKKVGIIGNEIVYELEIIKRLY